MCRGCGACRLGVWGNPKFENMSELKDHFRRMLLEFIEEIEAAKWQGKEREIVSRFTFSKLIQNVGCCDEFHHAAQICIEGRVFQVTGSSKKHVCKDMVFWRQPFQTIFDSPTPVPLCIIEWKHRLKEPSDYDCDWLKKYTKRNPECFGIALTVENETRYRMRAILIENGEIEDPNWI